MSVPVCPSSGCIDLNGFSGITVLGGTVQGTANGTGLANQSGNSIGIEAPSCTGCVINGTTIAGIYTRTSQSDTAFGSSAGGLRGIDISGSGWTIENVTIHDAGWGIVNVFAPGATGDTVSASNIYNVDHGWVPTFDGTGSRGSFFFTNNHVHDYANWDSGSLDEYHHDGIHCFTFDSSGAPAHFTDMVIAGNTFDGNPGQNVTADIFIEGGSGSGSTPCGDATSKVWIYNNTFTGTQPLSNGFIGAFSASPQIINNTFNGPGSGANVMVWNGNASGGSYENNLSENAGTLIALDKSAVPTVDHNAYAASGSNAFICGANFYSSLSSWQTCIGGDATANYTGTTTNTGANLTNLCTGDTTTLCTNRPQTGPWNTGAS